MKLTTTRRGRREKYTSSSARSQHEDPNPCMARHRNGQSSLEQDAPWHLHQLVQASLQAKDLPWRAAPAHQRLAAGRKHQGTTTAQQPTPTHPRYPSPSPSTRERPLATTSQWRVVQHEEGSGC
jgi:hypothetical protein